MTDPSEAAEPRTPDESTPTAANRGWTIDLALAGLVFAAALALRVIYVLQLQSSPYFTQHELDARYHVEWARAVAAGQEQQFLPQAYFRAPLYPWLLGAVFAAGGDTPLAPRIVQCVIGALTCALLYLLGRVAFGRVTGLIAGLTAATYWVLIYFDGELLMESLFAFLLTLLLLALLWAGQRPTLLRWLVVGVALGVAAITRPNILLLAPPAAVWALWLMRGRWSRGAAHAACLALGCLLPILPITIRNRVVGQDWVLIASQAGVNFYIGNHAGSDGVSARIPGDPGEWDAAMRAQTERAERAVGRTLKPSENSRWYTAQALAWMRENPGDALRHMLYKLRVFWTFWEIPNDHYIPFITRTFTPVIGALPFSFTRPELGFAIIAPLGALGLALALARGQRSRLFPLWGLLLVYMLSVVLFFVNARFRAPVLPVLILLAAHAAVWLAHQLGGARWTRLAGGAAALAAMGALVSFPPARVDLAIDHNFLWSQAAAGEALFAQQREDEALTLLSAATEQSVRHSVPLRAEAWNTIGLIQLKKGELSAAQRSFESAIGVKPDEPSAYQNLGVALAGQKRMKDAAAAFEQAVRLNPNDAQAQTNLGHALVRIGELDRGLELLRTAARSNPAALDAMVTAAEALVSARRHADALRVLNVATEVAPDDLRVLTPLIQLLTIGNVGDARDPARAARLAERAMRLSNGQDPIVLHAAATALWMSGMPEQALTLSERALQLARQRKNRALVTQIEALMARIQSGNDPNEP